MPSDSAGCAALPKSGDPAGERRPLGTLGEFAPPASTNEWLKVRAERYALQAVARHWMPNHAIADCHRRPACRDRPVQVWHSLGRDGRAPSAGFGCLRTCQSPWADPLCAGAISDYRRQELAHALAAHRGAGGAVLLLTYTARHHEGTALSALLAALLRAVRTMRRGKAFDALRQGYGHVGSVRATEITRGSNGWHPHFHELWFGDAGDVAALTAAIRPRWMLALEREGLDGLPAIAADVREASMTIDDYVTKYGCPRKWDVDAELAKGISKRGRGDSLMPFDFLRFGLAARAGSELSGQACTLYREYVLATKGKSTLQWSRGLRDRLGLRDVIDAEIAGGVDGLAVLLGDVGHYDWQRIMAADARLEVLAAAATGEWVAVQGVIDGLPALAGINKWQAVMAAASKAREVAS